MTTDTNDIQNIEQRGMDTILSEKYLAYALSTIMSRSLPDVRDGLKPVHRRLLFAMHQLKLSPNLSPKKCARVVGDVIGKFHPHGDQSVYDALVRLAQDFSVRYPLIDGQGNFGNIDGDNAAAMRYTESRLTEVTSSLLEGIDDGAIDYRPTYDGETMEPTVFPAAFPNLLANGSSGIAVGMATNIPPHNVDELCQAMEALIDGDPSVAELVEFVQGPDFPTGGTLVENKKDIINAYETGKGSFRVRAKWVKEDLKQGTYEIVVTEIPYQVQKSRLVEKIADLINAKKIPILDDVRDESAEDIRLVLVPKNRNVDPTILMEALYRYSDLETRFSMNMNVLDGGKLPIVMDLKQVLRAFLDHRQVVLVKMSNYRLEKVKHRLEILEGYLIAYLDLDEVIRIIREEDEPKKEMMKFFGLTEVQTEAILNMRLRSLRKLEEFVIKEEHTKLSKERDQLQSLLKSETRQWTTIRKQVQDIRKKFGKDNAVIGPRRTEIGGAPTLTIVPDTAMIEKEPITVVCSKMGWIRALRGHGTDEKDLKYKDGDKGQFVFPASTTDKILVLASNGRIYTIGGDKLPAGRGFGEPIRLMVDLPNDCDIVDMILYDESAKMLIAASTGHGFVVPLKDVLAQTKTGKQVLNVGDKAKASVCHMLVEGDDHVAVIGTNRKFLCFPLADLPEMARGKGVILQKYSKNKGGGGTLSDVKTFNMEEGLTFRYGSGARTEDVNAWIGGRATQGKLPPNGFPKSNRF